MILTAIVDGIAAKVKLAPETVSNIVRRGITECLVTDDKSDEEAA